MLYFAKGPFRWVSHLVEKMHEVRRSLARYPAAKPPQVRSKYSKNKVAILTQTFFDFDGNNMFFGGAERYVIELVHLARELGFDPEVYQCGNSDWERYYFDFKVTGLNVHGNSNALSNMFYKLNRSFQLVIYSSFILASRKLDVPTIGISHGIFWDYPTEDQAWYHAAQYARMIIGSIENCSCVVSVDTNTINWVRATSLLKAKNCMFIPNFVDLEQFKPSEQEKKSERITVLYPRRLYTPRGFWLISEILPELLHDFPQLDFHFVGKADPAEETRVRDLVNMFPERVKWYFLPPQEMHTAYQQVDITLIPTLYSEGTSLSCLEALASGNVVIATNVGGLPDLIFNGFNGLLVEPKASSLRRALTLVCEDAELRQRLKTNSRAVAETFNIQRWRDEWQRLLTEMLPKLPEHPAPSSIMRFAIVVPPVGVDWNSPAGFAHKTALDLTARGYETYWVNENGRSSSAIDNLHIVSSKDDLYLSGPQLFLFSTTGGAWKEQLQHAKVVFDAECNSIEFLDTMLDHLEK